MTVTLRLFAVAKARAGRPTISLELPDPATVADLKRALGEAVPTLVPALPSIRFAVDTEYATDQTPVFPHSQLAAIPPVSGG